MKSQENAVRHAAQVCAVFVEDHQLDNALRKCMEMIWWMHREAEENDNFELITTAEDIRRIKREGKCGGTGEEWLVERGHSDEVILKFLGENFMRVFEKVWQR